MRRNIIADESAILGLGGEYPRGKKPAMEIGIKEILIALGVVAAAGGGYAIAKKYDIGMDDISATIAYLEAKAVTFFDKTPVVAVDSPTQTLAPTPPAANASDVKVVKPERYVLDHNGIKIIGSIQFINDTALSLAYLEKFSPEDRLKCTNEIKSWDGIKYMAAGGGSTSVNASALHHLIEADSIATGIEALIHEDEHSCADKYYPERNTEQNSDNRSSRVWNALIKVKESDKKKFLKEFDFSKYEEQIQS